MIKKSSIRKSATCWWSPDDGMYLVESPLFERVGAQGNTEAEAMSQFETNLEFAYEQLLHNNVGAYDKSGRPAKNGVHIHVQVKTDTKKILSEMTKELGITQGELIDWALFALSRQQTKPNQHKASSYQAETLSSDVLCAENSTNAYLMASENENRGKIDTLKTALIGKIVKMSDSDIRDIAAAVIKEA
jgi:predicted RNase H-like HicB family nuclease